MGRHGIDDGIEGGPSRERIDRLVNEGKMPREAVTRAERFWEDRLRSGIKMANGEVARVTPGDLYHCLVDDRIWRKPERIERILMNVFEIRTAEQGRRLALSRWEEDGTTVVGYAILTEDSEVQTLHLVDERRVRRLRRRGDLLWRL